MKLFSVLKNMPQFRENRVITNRIITKLLFLFLFNKILCVFYKRIEWYGYPFDMKIFSMLKILAKAIIVKTSRGTQNTNNKQTETNGLG